VTYLCYACDVPYATFKRWKNDAFISKQYVPETKGKSVVTDKKLASQVYNPRKMYVTHSMAYWLSKHPSKTSDAKAKKVYRVFVLHSFLFLVLILLSLSTMLLRRTVSF
jgi:hypothetical protein